MPDSKAFNHNCGESDDQVYKCLNVGQKKTAQTCGEGAGVGALLAPLASLLFWDASEKICQRPAGRPKGSLCHLWLPHASGLSCLPLRSGSRHLCWSLFTNKGHASCSFFAI